MTDIPQPVQAVVDATNEGDSDAFVAAFAADGFIDDWGRIGRGHEGIRSWDRTDNIGKKSRFRIIDVLREGPDTYLVHIAVSGEGFNGTSPFRFVLAGPLVASMTIVPD